MSHVSYRFFQVLLLLSTAPVLVPTTLASTLQDGKVLTFNPDHEIGTSLPVWSNGALLEVKADRTSHPGITATDVNGTLFQEVYPSIDGASSIRVNAMTYSPDGRIVFSGFAITSKGQAACYLAISSPRGADLLMVPTHPYCPRQIAVSADGSIWTVGNIAPKSLQPDQDASGGIVRHFTATGKFLNSLFPQAAIDDSLRSRMGFIAASKGRIAWISYGDPRPGGLPRCGEYVEIESQTVHHYPLPPLDQGAGAVLYGLALTSNGAAFVSASVDQKSQRIFELNRTDQTWQVFSIPTVDITGSFLLGASDKALAIWLPGSNNIRFLRVEN